MKTLYTWCFPCKVVELLCLLYRRVLPILGHPMRNSFRRCPNLPNDNWSDLGGKEKKQHRKKYYNNNNIPCPHLYIFQKVFVPFSGNRHLEQLSGPRTTAIGFHNGPLVNGTFALHIIHLHGRCWWLVQKSEWENHLGCIHPWSLTWFTWKSAIGISEILFGNHHFQVPC